MESNLTGLSKHTDKRHMKVMDNLLKLFDTKIRNSDQRIKFINFLNTFYKTEYKHLKKIEERLAEVLKFKLPKKSIDTQIENPIHNHTYTRKIWVYSVDNWNIFHPLYLDLPLTIIIPYLEQTNSLAKLNKINRNNIYNKVIEDINVGSCSIYNPMWKYKEEFNKYKIKLSSREVMLRDLFEPRLNMNEFMDNMVVHSNDNTLFSSKKNKHVESNILQSILTRNQKTTYEPIETQLSLLTHYQHQTKIIFQDEQIDCINFCLESRFAVFAGSAGTGKTTTAMALLYLLLRRYESVTLLAISAKARNVIYDKIQHTFKNKLLTIEEDGSFSYSDGGKHITIRVMTIAKYMAINKYRKKASLKNTTIIIDEASMLGNSYLKYFLDLNSKRLILMGDDKQVLPVSQIGTPFISLIAINQNVCKLTRVNRQSSDNPVSNLIQSTIDKTSIDIPDYNGETRGVFFKQCKPQDVSELYLSLDQSSIAGIKPFGFATSSNDVQSLKYKGENPIDTYNGNGDKIPKKVFVGDKVMRISNMKVEKEDEDGYPIYNSDGEVEMIEYNNGDMGYVSGSRCDTLVIQYDNGKTESIQSKYFFWNFQLGYFQSAHKYQGSEFNIVVFNLLNNPRLYTSPDGKNIFYTTITRVKELLIICGEDKSKINELIHREFCLPVHDINSFYMCDVQYDDTLLKPDELVSMTIDEELESETESEEELEDLGLLVLNEVEPVIEPYGYYCSTCQIQLKSKNKSAIDAHNKSKRHVKHL